MVEKLFRVLDFAQIFIIGGAVMGFEMVASRFLYPYFGSGINTWAVLISAVLVSIALGYFLGGVTVRKVDPLLFSSLAVAVAGIYLVTLSFVAHPALAEASDRLGDGFIGLLAASLFVVFVPVALLGSLSPAFVTMFAKDLGNVGAVSGWIYAVSAIGNVCGILATTFIFIPRWGSQAITMGFGLILIASAALFWASFRVRRSN